MKHISKTILAALAIGLLSCGLFSQQAQAVGVTGEIHMAGDAIFNTPNLGFLYNTRPIISVLGHNTNMATTFGATGSFAVIPPEPRLARRSSPGYSAPSTPTAPLWDIPAFGFQFNLTSVLLVTHIGDNFLNVLATGTIVATGFDPTPALFSFTVNNPDGQTHDTYGFADATITIASDGGTTVMLLGAALGVLGIARRALKR